MNDYLYYDVYSIRSNVRDMLHNSNGILSNTRSMAQSLNKLDSLMDKGFSEVQEELADISYLLEDMLDVMIDFRNTTFIQNEKRNQLLASIDATLKAPNKTAANEKYEISLELASRNKHETAIQFLKEAIELNPLHFRSYVQLTLNLLKIKNYKEALHYAHESINFAPNNNEILAYTYSLVARASEKLKDYKGALSHINQAIHLNKQANYTYERARYYAFLGDVSRSMAELKKTIEMNGEYFAYSLVDRAFQPYHEEREELLTSLKQEIELKLNQAISKMEAIQFHSLKVDLLYDYELQYNGYSDRGVNYNLSGIKPLNFNQYKILSIHGMAGERLGYSFNMLFQEFKEYYLKLFDIHYDNLELIIELKSPNTYADFIRSYNQYISFKKEFNHVAINLKRLVNEYKEISTIAEQTFKANLDFAMTTYNETKRRLREEKGKRVTNLLGVISAFLPVNIQHNHNNERVLGEIIERLEEVVKEAQNNVENAGKHVSAIRHFANEVLIEKPIPNPID